MEASTSVNVPESDEAVGRSTSAHQKTRLPWTPSNGLDKTAQIPSISGDTVANWSEQVGHGG